MSISRRETRLGRRWARLFAAEMLERALAGHRAAVATRYLHRNGIPASELSAWDRDGVDSDGFEGVSMRMAYLREEGVRALIAQLRRGEGG